MPIELTEEGEIEGKITQEEYEAELRNLNAEASSLETRSEALHKAAREGKVISAPQHRQRRNRESDLSEVSEMLEKRLDALREDLSKLLTTPDYMERMIKQVDKIEAQVAYIHAYIDEDNKPKKGIWAKLGW
jgi:hypothetical protein